MLRFVWRMEEKFGIYWGSKCQQGSQVVAGPTTGDPVPEGAPPPLELLEPVVAQLLEPVVELLEPAVAQLDSKFPVNRRAYHEYHMVLSNQCHTGSVQHIGALLLLHSIILGPGKFTNLHCFFL